MKRLFEEKEMARVLLLVSSRGGQAMPMPMPVCGRGDRALGAPAERAFVCKTCDRVFPSFQALGGHRASHKKPRLDGDGGDLAKPKLHGCSVCGLEFAVGQALGGHMRRHRGEPAVQATAAPACGETQPEVIMPDLNYPPMMEDCGGDGQDSPAGDRRSEHPLLDLLV